MCLTLLAQTFHTTSSHTHTHTHTRTHTHTHTHTHPLQVEVGCGERGRALAGVWNAFVAAHQESVEALHRHAAAQQAEIHEVGGFWVGWVGRG